MNKKVVLTSNFKMKDDGKKKRKKKKKMKKKKQPLYICI